MKIIDNHWTISLETIWQYSSMLIVSVIYFSAEHAPQMSHDTTVLIVVGSVVSVCLTTLAVLMVFYLRSKVFDTIPMGIYDNEKHEGDDKDNGNTIGSLKITNTTLPRELSDDYEKSKLFMNVLEEIFSPSSYLILFCFNCCSQHCRLSSIRYLQRRQKRRW